MKMVCRSRQQTKLLAELNGLGPSLGPQFVEDAAGMRLDGVLADEELAGDLAVAHALRDELKNLQFAARNTEILSFFLVQDEPLPGQHRDFLHNNRLLRPCELESEPDTKN